MRLAVFALAAVAANTATARTVALDGEYGCNLLWHQAQRLQLMEVASSGSLLKAQGRETPASKSESARAAAEIVRISNTECRPLIGKFKVLESRDVQGGKALRVEQPGGSYLWVLE